MIFLFLLLTNTTWSLETYTAKEISSVDFGGSNAMAFPISYNQARERFRYWGTRLKLPTHPILVASNVDPDLTIDTLFVPSEVPSKKLVIITSGIHGAEAATGHAIQMLVLQEFVQNKKFPHLNYLFIHAMNPYGFKYLTRTNENNIDLNRNFGSEDEFKLNNNEYDDLQVFLEPKIPLHISWWQKLKFAKNIFYHVYKYGKKSILLSLRGQFKSAKGIFYGGTQNEPQTLQIQELIKKYSEKHNEIYHVDLHTGFGKKGQLHFFGSDELDSPAEKRIQSFFSEHHVDTGRDENFYPTYGDFSDWMMRTFKDQQPLSMTFEFGTLDSQTLLGGLDSLWITVSNNQARHYGFENPNKDPQKERAQFERLFNPQDHQWQLSVLKQSYDVFGKTLEKFEIK